MMITSRSQSQQPLNEAPARPRPLPTPNCDPRRGVPASGGANSAPTRSPFSEASSSSSSASLTSTSIDMQTAGRTDYFLGQSMLGLSLRSSPPQRERELSFARASSGSPLARNGQTAQGVSPPGLIAPLPTTSSLQDDAVTIRTSDAGPEKQVKWIRDVLFLVNRSCSSPSAAVSADTQIGALVIDDPALEQLANCAIELLLTLVPSVPPAGSKLSPPIAEALYHRASLTQSGAFPAHIPENPRKAFRAFETSARAGHYASWFKLGRCYEAFDDFRRAKECFERGVKYDDVSCLYRMGMAHLMGQLGLEASPAVAVPLLFRAAERATVAVPQPSYVYGSLLLGDFAHTSAMLPSSLFAPYIPSGSDIEQEAQRFLERAAYLHFTPAQYKLGYYYEFARPPYAYDPLLSVQYYTLASDAEPEACMALSKWFLCGAEGFFEKDEILARTFAERAARAGLPSAEFAMGYYWEIGIGSQKDLQRAKKWYEKASVHGNADATDRLTSLVQDEQLSLSRQDHDRLAEQTLVRRRTQAKQRSDLAGSIRRTGQREDAEHVVELVRKASKIQPRAERVGRAAKKSLGLDSSASLETVANTATEMSYGWRRNSGGLKDIDESPRRHGRDSTSNSATLAPPTHFPERKRYSLVDPGPSSRSSSPLPQPQFSEGTQTPPRRYASPSPAPTSRTGSEVGSSMFSSAPTTSSSSSPSFPPVDNTSPPENSRPQRVRYSTFAEMGIQSTKLEEKDCIIM
ncbi:hypothetical protein ACEPAH_1392 [Sanghuangporus vaninii]